MSDTPPPVLSSEEGFRLLRQWDLALEDAARHHPNEASAERARTAYREARAWFHERGERIPLELSGGPDVRIRHRAKSFAAQRRRRFLLYAIAAAAIVLFIVLLTRGR